MQCSPTNPRADTAGLTKADTHFAKRLTRLQLPEKGKLLSKGFAGHVKQDGRPT